MDGIINWSWSVAVCICYAWFL